MSCSEETLFSEYVFRTVTVHRLRADQRGYFWWNAIAISPGCRTTTSSIPWIEGADTGPRTSTQGPVDRGVTTGDFTN